MIISAWLTKTGLLIKSMPLKGVKAILVDTHHPLCAELFLYVIVMLFLSEGALYKVPFKVEQLWSLTQKSYQPKTFCYLSNSDYTQITQSDLAIFFLWIFTKTLQFSRYLAFIHMGDVVVLVRQLSPS